MLENEIVLNITRATTDIFDAIKIGTPDSWQNDLRRAYVKACLWSMKDRTAEEFSNDVLQRLRSESPHRNGDFVIHCEGDAIIMRFSSVQHKLMWILQNEQ